MWLTLQPKDLQQALPMLSKSHYISPTHTTRLLLPLLCVYQPAAQPFGIFLGMAVVLILTETLSHSAMLLFGWRIAFLLGALTGVVGVMLRRRMPDPTVFLQRKHAIEEQLDAAGSSGVPDDR